MAHLIRFWKQGCCAESLLSGQNVADVYGVWQQGSESEQRYAGCQSLAVNDSMSHTRVSANAVQASSEVALQQIGDDSARVSVKMGVAGGR